MSELPAPFEAFVDHAGWGGSAVEALAGDASFRRYYRLRRGKNRALLMHAPPPQEDPNAFFEVARYLAGHGLRAPQIIAKDLEQGLMLIEDFGDWRMRDWLDARPQDEIAAYETAVENLVELHRAPPGPFGAYDHPTYRREADLFIEWYCPAMGLSVDAQGWARAWDEALASLGEAPGRSVSVLRDYHAENIMLLGDPPDPRAQGLIDFQDALVGHPAYDLVSLLQDARREVAPALEKRMIAHYLDRAQASGIAPHEEFQADYARLGAQRNAKIVGIFTRLYKRDGKPRYLALIPRVWRLLERDLEHRALKPVAEWFAQNIPGALRESGGGTIA